MALARNEPFGSARAAVYPDVLGEAYPLGAAVTMTTYQTAQVLGFAIAGAVVGLAGARAALLADAGTFLGSAVIVLAWVHRRAAPAEGRAGAPARSSVIAAARLTLGHRPIRIPMLLGWISWAYNVPEGLAVPLARSSGGGAIAASAIMAAAALGSSAGSLALARLRAHPAALASWASRRLHILSPGTGFVRAGLIRTVILNDTRRTRGYGTDSTRCRGRSLLVLAGALGYPPGGWPPEARFQATGEGAVQYGQQALNGQRKSLPSLLMVSRDLTKVLNERYPNEPATATYLDQILGLIDR
jgi:hypothetical protein